MERYDGKTKRDDYIKYGLIAAGVLLLILGYALLTGYLKRTYSLLCLCAGFRRCGSGKGGHRADSSAENLRNYFLVKYEIPHLLKADSWFSTNGDCFFRRKTTIL